jgi:hypothetical protein
MRRTEHGPTDPESTALDLASAGMTSGVDSSAQSMYDCTAAFYISHTDSDVCINEETR